MLTVVRCNFSFTLWLFILLQMKKVINVCMYIFLAIFTLEMMIKVKI